MSDSERVLDRWARWILEGRFAGDPRRREGVLAFLEPIRDRVLAAAEIERTDTVVDVGCGDGLLGFGAMDRLDTEGRVVFTDVSPDLVERCREVAAELDLLQRCDFVVDSLPGLSEHADSSADVAVLRSVLIYVSDKQGAFDNLYRVLKAGGRFSLFEPIVGFAFPEPSGWLWELDVRGLEHLADKVHACYRRYQENDDPMVDFDERDLFHAALEAGFVNVRMTYEVLVEDHPPYEDTDWETFLRAAPNPNVPSNGEILREGLQEPEEYARLSAHMRRQLGDGTGRTRRAYCYLQGVRR